MVESASLLVTDKLPIATTLSAGLSDDATQPVVGGKAEFAKYFSDTELEIPLPQIPKEDVL